MALIVVCLLTSGCIPQRFTYLEPAAFSGRAEPYIAHCGGPKDTITFAPANLAVPNLVEVRLTAIPPSETLSQKLALIFDIRKNVHVEWSLIPSSVQTQQKRSARYSELKEMPIDVEVTSDTASLSWVSGSGARKLLSSNEDRHFVLRGVPFHRTLEVAGFSGDRLEVRLPPIRFDGHTLDFSPIQFHLDTRVLIMPINC